MASSSGRQQLLLSYVINAQNQAAQVMAAQNASLAQMQQQMAALQQQTTATNTTLANNTQQMAGAAAQGAVLGSVLGTVLVRGFEELKDQLSDSVTQAAKFQAALVGVSSIAKNTGRDVGEVQRAAVELSADGLQTVTDAATELKNLLAKGLSIPQAIELIKGLKDTAAFGRQGFLSYGQAIAGATEGIRNGLSAMSDNAGVTKNLSNIYKDAGLQVNDIGNKFKNLADAQKFVNSFTKETAISMGDAAKYADTYAGQVTQLQRNILDLKIAIGTQLMPILANVNSVLSLTLKIFKDSPQTIRDFTIIVGELVVALGGLLIVTKIIPLFGDFSKVVVFLGQDIQNFVQIQGSLQGATIATAGAFTLLQGAVAAFAAFQLGKLIGDILVDLDKAAKASDSWTASILNFVNPANYLGAAFERLGKAYRSLVNSGGDAANTTTILANASRVAGRDITDMAEAQKILLDASKNVNAALAKGTEAFTGYGDKLTAELLKIKAASTIAASVADANKKFVDESGRLDAATVDIVTKAIENHTKTSKEFSEELASKGITVSKETIDRLVDSHKKLQKELTTSQHDYKAFNDSVKEFNRDFANAQKDSSVSGKDILSEFGPRAEAIVKKARELHQTVSAEIKALADEVAESKLREELAKIETSMKDVADASSKDNMFGENFKNLTRILNEVGGVSQISDKWLIANREDLLKLSETTQGKAIPQLKAMLTAAQALDNTFGNLAEGFDVINNKLDGLAARDDSFKTLQRSQAELYSDLDKLGRTSVDQEIRNAQTALQGKLNALDDERDARQAAWAEREAKDVEVTAAERKAFADYYEDRKKLFQAEMEFEKLQALGASKEQILYAGQLYRASVDGDEAMRESAAKRFEEYIAWLEKTKKAQELLTQEIDKMNKIIDSISSVAKNLGFGAIADDIDRMGKSMTAGKQAGFDLKTSITGFSSKDMLGSIANVAAAISGIVDAMNQATNSSSRMKNAIGGALTGAQIGGQIAGPYGAIGGAIVGGIIGAFRKPEWAKLQKDIANDFGVQVSDALAKAIENSEKMLQQFNNQRGLLGVTNSSGQQIIPNSLNKDQLRDAAESLNLDKIIDEGGGLNSGNFDAYVKKAESLIDIWKLGGSAAAAATKEMDTLFGQFADHADFWLNGQVTPAFQELIDKLKDSGMEVRSVEEYLRQAQELQAQKDKEIADSNKKLQEELQDTIIGTMADGMDKQLAQMEVEKQRRLAALADQFGAESDAYIAQSAIILDIYAKREEAIRNQEAQAMSALQFELQGVQLNGMKDGTAKQLAQLNLQKEQRLAALKAQLGGETAAYKEQAAIIGQIYDEQADQIRHAADEAAQAIIDGLNAELRSAQQAGVVNDFARQLETIEQDYHDKLNSFQRTFDEEHQAAKWEAERVAKQIYEQLTANAVAEHNAQEAAAAKANQDRIDSIKKALQDEVDEARFALTVVDDTHENAQKRLQHEWEGRIKELSEDLKDDQDQLAEALGELSELYQLKAQQLEMDWADKLKEEVQKATDSMLDLRSELQDVLLDQLQDGAAKELAVLDLQKQRRMAALKEQFGEESDAYKEQSAVLEQIFDLRAKAITDKEQAATKANIDASLKSAQAAYYAIANTQVGDQDQGSRNLDLFKASQRVQALQEELDKYNQDKAASDADIMEQAGVNSAAIDKQLEAARLEADKLTALQNLVIPDRIILTIDTGDGNPQDIDLNSILSGVEEAINSGKIQVTSRSVSNRIG